MFVHRHRSPLFHVMARLSEAVTIRAAPIEVEFEFYCDVVDERGLMVPEEALGRLDDEMRKLLDGTLAISQQDPHADDLVKLKRIKAVAPTLFEYGTTGPQIAFYFARWVEQWLSRERWNTTEGPHCVRASSAIVRIGRDEFTYLLGEPN